METEILEKLYKSEINFQIETFYDEGYTVKLGDKSNGYKAVVFDRETFKEAVETLAKLASKEYPRSEFAKWWKEQQEKNDILQK